jgi:hypothetical protein
MTKRVAAAGEVQARRGRQNSLRLLLGRQVGTNGLFLVACSILVVTLS